MKMTTESFVDLTMLSVQNLDPKCLIMDDLFLQPVNNFSVMSGWVFLCWTSTKQIWLFPVRLRTCRAFITELRIEHSLHSTKQPQVKVSCTTPDFLLTLKLPITGHHSTSQSVCPAELVSYLTHPEIMG